MRAFLKVKMERSIFDESPLTSRDFIEWLEKADPDLVFDARRPQGCLLALFLKAQIGERFFTTQQTSAVIDRHEHSYGSTWAAQVAGFELQLATSSSRVGRAPSAADIVLVRVGDIRNRLLDLLSEFG